jgi:serine/threonine protein kinase
MAAPTTIDQMVALIHRSGLIDAGRLEAFVRHTDAHSPRQLARRLVSGGLLTTFQAEQVLLGKSRGFTLGKYKVLERIGYGGNGTVYLCEHTIVRRKVALKVLPTNRAASTTALTRFYREARAAGALDHPNLVKAHDVDQDNGLHFLVMDYIDGGNLQDLVTRCGPLEPARAANYIAQAACGLEAAHAAGLVHRDIKPANILLDRHGVVRVSDLGLARFHGEHHQPLTLRYDEKVVLGTADYVAPEQALNSHDVDGRADLYGLGATFHFLLTGKPPFPGGKAAQKLMQHQVKPPPPVRSLRPEVPEEMAAVVARLLAKEPAQRFQTAAEVVAALAPWAHQPVPPPTEAELPLLSPAARGPASGDADPSSATLRRIRLAPLSGPGPVSTNPAPAAPAAEVPTARVLTTPGDSAAPAAPPTAAPETLTVDRKRGIKDLPRVMRLALLLAVGLVASVVFRWVAGRPAAAPVSAATLIVNASGVAGTFPTLAAALSQAPPGARILLTADTWEEALIVPPADARPVCIEGQSPSGRPVVWRAPKGHRAVTPLLQVNGRAEFTLTGMVLDGGNHVEDLVVLAGPCPGVCLRDVQLRGFRGNGLRLRGWTPDEGRPITLERLRLTPGSAASP